MRYRFIIPAKVSIMTISHSIKQLCSNKIFHISQNSLRRLSQDESAKDSEE